MKIFYFILLFIVFKAKAQTSVLTIADSLYVNGNYSKAIVAYKSYKNPPEVYHKIAKAYMAIGNYDEALHHFEAATQANPNNPLLKYEFAKLLSKTKNFETAFLKYKELVSMHEENPNYHYELGLVQEQLKDSLAINSFSKAFSLDDTHQKAIYKIAKYNLQKRKHTIVDTLINKGLETYPNNVELISLKAQNYYWQQNYRKAATYFEQLIALGETSEFIYEKLSLCYAYHYKYEEALKYRLKALDYNPNDAATIYVIGTYYLELKNYPEAEAYINKALAFLDKPLGNEYGKLATALNYQKKYPEAITALKKAIKESPDNPFMHFRLALVLEKYYDDYDAKIKAFEDVKNKFQDSMMNELIDRHIKKLKEEQFNNQEKKTD